MKKNPYPRSFANRLTWRITLTLLIVMGIATYLIFYTARGLIYAEGELLFQKMVKSKGREVCQMISEVSVACTNVVPEIEDNLDHPDRMYALMERMVKLNPRIRSCGISFKENYYSQKGRWFCPYAVREDSTEVKVKTLGDAKHDYLKAEWFKQAMAAEKGYWADPFIDGVDKETPLVPYVVPVRNKQGQTVAILGADLSLYGLSKDMDVVRQGKSNNRGADEILEFSFDCFIIDSVGTYIMHGDSARVGRENYFTYAEATPETLDDYVGKQMISGFEGSFFEDRNDSTLMIEGKQVHAYYMPLENTCWSIGLLVPGIIIDIIGYVVGAVLIFFIIIGLLIVLIVGRVSIKRAAKPLKQLATSAGEVAKGRFDTPLPQLKSRDEIHLLRDSFDEMQHSLTRYVEELKSATAQKSALENELRIAHDIQMSMLPKTFPPFPDRSDIDIYGTLTPAKGVGGDLFDFHIRDEKLFFCIGDVSGKGIPAALVMAVTRSLFRNISSYATRPNDIVYALNNALADGNDTNMFVTIFLGVLDLPTGRLLYCNAGHNSPLLVGRKVGELPCDSNLPVGITPNYTFVMQEADIDPQTTIFLFTDGLNEAENNTHAQFGDERIREVAGRVLAKGEQQPLNLIYEMSEAVHRFVNGAEQSDDLTMLAVQYKVGSKEVS